MYATSGTATCFFTLATNNRRQIEGEWKDVKIYWNVTAFGKTAERAAEQIGVNSLVTVVGGLEHTLDGNPPVKEYNGKTTAQYKLVASSVVVNANRKEKPAEPAAETSEDKQPEFDWSKAE